MSKKVITFGEVMLRLATPEYKRFSQSNIIGASFGGGEVNVSVSLANFGVPTSFVTCLPDNDIGKSCKENLNELGVETDFIRDEGERLGIYFLETGAVSRGSKVVYDRANSAFTQLKKGAFNWDDIFSDAQWFHWTGIIPAISEGATEVLKEALNKAEEYGVLVSCDVNYRSKLWGAGITASEIMPELIEKTDILIGNEFDAVQVLGIEAELVNDSEYSNDSFQQVSAELRQKYPKLKKIITTRRGTHSANYNTWMGIISDGKKVYQSPIYDMTHIVDRVGGGDSLMAGLIYGLVNFPEDDQRIIDFAVAASCIKHTVYGDVNLASVEEVESLMRGELKGRINW